jgi:hypothetical protein
METTSNTKSAKSRIIHSDELATALLAVRSGYSEIHVVAGCHVTRIQKSTLQTWDKVPGNQLLRTEGDGFRMRSGKGSVFLFPGQLILREAR